MSNKTLDVISDAISESISGYLHDFGIDPCTVTELLGDILPDVLPKIETELSRLPPAPTGEVEGGVMSDYKLDRKQRAEANELMEALSDYDSDIDVCFDHIGMKAELIALREMEKRLEYITEGRALLKDMTGPNGEMVGYVVIELSTEEVLGSGKTKNAAIDAAREAMGRDESDNALYARLEPLAEFDVPEVSEFTPGKPSNFATFDDQEGRDEESG